jgi:phosphomannomutase
MPPRFGTSGLRGLVTELTPDLVADHVRAFASACDTGGRLMLGQDLRASSPAIAAVVAAAARRAGLDVTACGEVPTPALALAAAQADGAAVMVTGSHIPDDRNGLKFYRRGGEEISKADEAAILAALDGAAGAVPDAPPLRSDPGPATAAYAARYLDAFGPEALTGLRLGLYQHSSVARDLLADLLTALGAEVTPLGRSSRFIPVDTEAVDAATQRQLVDWARQGFDALLSTDGDGDRPLMTDAAGKAVPGDLLGLLTARRLGARIVVTPVSSTTAIEASGEFDRVIRTRIGSPHVIAGIAMARAEDPAAKVVGFEANGGFLLGFPARFPGGTLAPLNTRDAVLPLLAPLLAMRESRRPLRALLDALPPRHTAADRLQEVDMARAAALISRLGTDPEARRAFFGRADTAIDLTDGLRLGFGPDIVHLRPSGNAPELRAYVETGDEARSAQVLADTLERLRNAL